MHTESMRVAYVVGLRQWIVQKHLILSVVGLLQAGKHALSNFQNLSSNKKRWRPARLSSKGEELRHAHSTELPILLRGEPALVTLPRRGWSTPEPLKVGSHSFVWRESSNG